MAFKMHCIDGYIQHMEEEKHMPQDNFKVKEVFIGQRFRAFNATQVNQ
jgi:hypothetical protein